GVAPRILFVKEGPYLDLLATAGADVVSLEELLQMGTPEQVSAASPRWTAEVGGQRHLVNLNHGADRRTPVANFEASMRGGATQDAAPYFFSRNSSGVRSSCFCFSNSARSSINSRFSRSRRSITPRSCSRSLAA